MIISFKYSLFLLIFVLSACTLSSPEPTSTTEPPTEAITVPVLPTRTENQPITPSVNINRPTINVPTANPLFTETPMPIGVRGEAATATIAPISTTIPASSVTATSEFTFPTIYPSVYDVSLRQGQTLLVNYDVTIYNPGQGRVFLVVRDPSGNDIYRLVVTETKKDTAEVPAEVGGQYQILAAPENISGQYSVSYGFRN